MFGWTFEYTVDQPIQRLTVMVEDVMTIKNGSIGREEDEQEQFMQALGG